MNHLQLPDFKRDIVSKINHRLSEKRKFIQVVIGPRQVGKTTAVKQALTNLECDAHYAAADLPAPPMPGWISQQWEIARFKCGSSKKYVLVIDEIQKILNWSDEVKKCWDEDSSAGANIHVILLGSSALLVQKGLGESLAGRFEILRLSHWSWTECQKCFSWTLEQFLYFGGYPGAAPLIGDNLRWRQYICDSLIETALSKDILLLNRIEKPAVLRQLFVLACNYSGQILSYQKILGNLSDVGNTTTVAHYQSLLEAAFLIKGLGKWSGTAIRRRNSSPKWLALNTSLMTGLSGLDFEDWRLKPENWGRLVETACGAHLVNSASEYGIGVYYWREGNHEVDFVIQKGKEVVAFEIKSGKQAGDLRGLEFFLRKQKQAKAYVVGRDGISIDEFLKTPAVDWFSKDP